jgi:lipopolysaccharide biosynthesis glycosyltransferase
MPDGADEIAYPEINVLFSVDAGYWQHFAVALLSLLENMRDASLRVLVVVDARHPEKEARIKLMASKYPCVRFNFYVIDTTSISHFRVDDHITVASYFRLFLASFLDTSITKLIYLDSDLVVRHNLLDLWKTDVSGHYMAAVPDPYSDKHTNLGFALSDTYFNAGVLVINVARWRTEDIKSRFVSYIEANASILRYHDQDALNAVLKGGILQLDYKWNFQARMGSLPYRALVQTKSHYRTMKEDPAIVHYTTKMKPWNTASGVNYGKLYFSVLARTPWHASVSRERSIIANISKVCHLNNIRRTLKWYAPELAWLVLGRREIRKAAISCSYHLKLVAHRK